MILAFLSSLVWCVFSLALIFKTEWVASFVGVTRGTDLSSISVSPRALLKVGIILVGMNFFRMEVHQLVALIASIQQLTNSGYFQNTQMKVEIFVRIFKEAFPVALSLIYIFGSEKMIQLLEKFNTEVS